MGFFKFWRDYRAFKSLPRDQRRLVFYSESAQDWHHIETIIHRLTDENQQSLCYVASDETDEGLKQSNPLIRPFCIGSGFFRILWFQTLEADVMVTQLLDLDNLDLKRSVHPVHYVHIFHSLVSTHMADHENSFDHYDTILCAGPHQMREIRQRESMQNLAEKQLLPHGYHRLEDLIANRREPPPINTPGDIHVLLAPSWGDQTILNMFGLELITVLLAAGFRVTLRPHFQTRWNTPEVLDRIIGHHSEHPAFFLVEEMGESDSLFDSHVMITDWSGAGMDYGMGLEKPVLYMDVPPKSRNNSWQNLGIEPFESLVRDKIGAILAPREVERAPELIRELVANPDEFRDGVRRVRDDSVFNLGSSTEAGAAAILQVVRQAAGKNNEGV
jgi:hypothetical protein